jgi:cytochrome d ubiquinol oxidase subunit I
MVDGLDMLLLARIQFAFTISFHILFPAFTIGLAGYLVALEVAWLRTRHPRYRELYDFWLKLFAISFGMGVVSGVVLSYQIGTNWSGFSAATGNVLGPLLGYEVLMAFFLEASFLGIMLFGRDRVGPGMHLAATVIVAVGTLFSAFWILAANSWMQTPAGFELRDGVFYATDWLAVIFNPSLPYRFTHMVLACYLSTALVVAAVAAWHLGRGQHYQAARTMLAVALPFIAVVATLQALVGHEHGVNVHHYQPAKLAAMEGHWESYERDAPLILFGLPDAELEANRWELAVPKVGSLVVTGTFDGAIRGLKSWPADQRPPVAPVFWSFRVMVGLGLLMITLGGYGSWLLWRGRLTTSRRFLRLTTWMAPAGFVALLAGWFTAEIGRQPYVVYGLLRTADAASPVTGDAVAMSLMIYVTVYAVIFGAGIHFLLGIARRGPGGDPGAAAGEPAVEPGGRA